MTYPKPDAPKETFGIVSQLIGDEAFYTVLLRMTRIDGIAHPVGIYPLYDGIGKLEEKGVEVEEQFAMEKIAAGAHFIIRAVLRL